ncbi:MAG: hypothetical protein FWC15_05140 [Fibromonadales bacterium]|nr:hypothetical protein [Fibromonadales bacterium]
MQYLALSPLALAIAYALFRLAMEIVGGENKEEIISKATTMLKIALAIIFTILIYSLLNAGNTIFPQAK